MNEWIRQSIDIATSRNYLDTLHQIYNVGHELRRPIDQDVRIRIEKLFQERNKIELVKLLMAQKRFPYQEPYLGFLREDPSALSRNPQTIERIIRTLYTTGLDKIIAGIEEPPQANRQLGALFRQWLQTLPYPFLPEEGFVQSKGTAFLAGSNGRLFNFANEKLGCDLKKRPDFVAKTGRKYVIGEAKFITTGGGNQDNHFREVIEFVQDSKGNAVRVGVLDGIVWVKQSGLYASVRSLNKPVMTALLLSEFLESLA